MPTDAEVFGGKGLSDAEVFGRPDPAVPDTPWDRFKSVLADTGKELAKVPGATADLVAGIPGQALGIGGNIAGRVGAVIEGKNRQQVEEEGARLQEHVPAAVERFFRMPPRALSEPVQTIIKTLTGQQPMDQKIVGDAIDKVSTGIDRITRGYVSAASAKLLIDSAMLAYGAKGVDIGVAAALKPRVKTGAAARTSYLTDEEVFAPGPEPVSMLAGEDLQKSFVRDINKGVKELEPPAIKELFKRAKSPEAFVENLFARAAQEGKATVDAKQARDIAAYSDPEIGSKVGSVEKTRLAEGRVIGAEETPVIDPTLDSALRKVSADQRFDLTAEERIALQDVAQKAGIVDSEGRPISSRQGGFSDIKLALAIAAATGLSIGAIKYIEHNEPELRDLIRARVRKLFGAPPDGEEQRRATEKNNEDWRHLNEDLVPLQNDEGNGLAKASEALGPLADKGPGVEDFLGPLVFGMAVKGKGGMWHPEAAARLIRPLQEPFERGLRIEDAGETWAAQETAKKWAPRAVQNYLNKHAGTEGDPLKDIELPNGKRWEEVMDKSLWNLTGKYPIEPEIKARMKEGEPLYWLNTGTEFVRPIQEYLSHVGDYLRQNVPADKLPQYDLVRAVKETAKNDERVAREMEKATADSTAQLPVYKDYGDGMKWVELKLPEKLTAEQARSVKLTDPEHYTGRARTDEISGNLTDSYVALDTKGKPIENSYTREKATGPTPEAAYLAGRLAEEGNQLGHCVGGYCEAVASGESKIYSLRDAKGKSHVTVEVEPPVVKYNENGEATGEVSPGENIVQIKGKQNRAPAERYLPYVQDFVRSGKWGEVGDLENTGLHDIQQGKINSKPFNDLAEELYPGRRFLETKEADRLQEEGIRRTLAEEDRAKGQRGSIDPKLLAGIAVAGSVAAYLSDRPEDTETLAAAGLLAGTRKGLGQIGRGLDYTLGLVSTRLGQVDPALRLRARDYERVVMERTDKALDRVSPFLHEVKEVRGEAGKELKLALLSGDAQQIASAIKGSSKLVAGWRETQNLLREFEQEHLALGRFKEGLTNYFPRIVEDFEGLKNAIGQEARTRLETTLAREEAKMIKEQQRGLTDIERSLIVNRSLTADSSISSLPDYARGRRIRELTQQLEPFYASPTDSLLRYISAAVQDAELAKFFGRNLATKKQGSKIYTDVDTSIGNVVAKAIKDGMPPEQANELRALLKSRFEGGEQAMSGPLQDVRNVTNMGLLGNFLAAGTQMGDSIMTIYHHGLMPVLRAVKDKLTGDSEVTTKQFGLVNHIAEELGSARATGKGLQFLFKYSGFSAIDQFAKGLNLNAALIKNRAAAQSVKGLEQLQVKYGKAFGDEFPQLVSDLRSERMTERVKSLLFSELSDAQPISKMELPQAYLDHPNGRILYQMKTYMLKQMDVIRRDAYDEIAKGNYVKGAKNLLAVAAALSLSNVPGDIVKNWIRGRPVDLSKIDYIENLLQNFGLNRYTTDKMTSETPAKGAVEFVGNTVRPPILSMIQDADDPKKLMKYVPFIGRTIYDRELGGNEAAYMAEQRRERLKQRALREAENPGLRDARRLRDKRRREAMIEKARRSMP